MSTGRALSALPGRLRNNLRDPILRNSYVIMTTTLLMAAAGAIFWVVVARISPAEEVGLASSLASAGDSLGLFSLLGMDFVLLRVLPRSDRKAADVNAGMLIVATAALVLGGGYALLLGLFSPRLHAVLGLVYGTLFALLVVGTAVNTYTDHLFIAVDKVTTNLRINGLLLGALKLSFPFALAGLGAFGLYASLGLATTCAAVLSIVVIQRTLSGRVWRRPSQEFRSSMGFARAVYVVNSLNLLPPLVFPLLIINELGPAQSAAYFVGYQVVTLLNQVAFSMGNALYAEASRLRSGVRATVRRIGGWMASALIAGAVVLIVVAPLLLSVFGKSYADAGTDNLRLLALGSLGVGLNTWSSVRLRIVAHHGWMVAVQLVTTTTMLGLAVGLVHLGIEGVAFGWGMGQLVGGLLGFLASCTVVRLPDSAVADPVTTP